MSSQVSRLFRHGNRVTFIRDLEQRLSEILAMKDSYTCKFIVKCLCANIVRQVKPSILGVNEDFNERLRFLLMVVG